MPPANAPIPTTDPTAARGNMSLASVYTLADQAWCAAAATLTIATAAHMLPASGANAVGTIKSADRKSTRLNSSHSQISYAVFCLKKKKHTQLLQHTSHQ